MASRPSCLRLYVRKGPATGGTCCAERVLTPCQSVAFVSSGMRSFGDLSSASESLERYTGRAVAVAMVLALDGKKVEKSPAETRSGPVTRRQTFIDLMTMALARDRRIACGVAMRRRQLLLGRGRGRHRLSNTPS